MKSILQYYSLLFLTSTISISSAAPHHAETRTTRVAELLGKQFRHRRSLLISGNPNGVYGIWSLIFSRERIVVNLNRINGYVLEVPQTDSSEYAQYAITVTTKCPDVFELKNDTRGYVFGTFLPWKTVYSTIRRSQNYVESTPCNIVEADSTPIDPESSDVPLGLENITLYLNAITSFQYYDSQEPNEEVPHYDPLYVKRDGDTYIEGKFFDAINDDDIVENKTCRDVYNGDGGGKELAELGYNFAKSLSEPSAACRLSTSLAVVVGTDDLYDLGFTELSFVVPISNEEDNIYEVYRLSALVTSNIHTEVFRWLRQVCARLAECN